MRPKPIADDYVLPGSKRIVVGPPGNNLDSIVAPVEACALRLGNGILTLSVRMELEDGDLEKLARGGAVWLTFMEHMVPFEVQIEDV